MTDDPLLTPRQELAVRRLLADARLDEPIPTDVAARLDRVLAEVARDQAHPPATVGVLASRRRRRVASLLVAAAAAVVVGVGLSQVLDPGDGSLSSVALDAPDRAGAAGAAGEDEASSQGRSNAPHSSRARVDGVLVGVRAVRVRPGSFSSDVRRSSRLLERNAADLPAAASSDERGARSCLRGHWGRATFVPVRYAGAPGLLAFRRPQGDTRVVDLYVCGDSEVLRSITLPAP